MMEGKMRQLRKLIFTNIVPSEKNDAMGRDENCSCCNGSSSMEPTLLSKSAIVVFNAQEV